MSSNIVMNKSQLRKLAREYALGNLEEGEYLDRRQTLIDDITSGKVAIVREVPPPPPQAYSEDPTTKVSIGGRPGVQRVSPAALLIALVIVAGVVWMLIPTGGQEDPNIAQPAHAPPVSRARSLIDEFVNEKDFSAFSIASFKESWSHLTYAEKREAYSAHWFNDLITLISDEIKAQNALVGSEDSAKATETGKRLSAFAAFLGISKYVTEFKGPPAQPAVPRAAGGARSDTESSATLDGGVPRQTTPAATVAAAENADPGVEPTATAKEVAPRLDPRLSTGSESSHTDPGVKLASVNENAPPGGAPAQRGVLPAGMLTPVPDSEWLGAQSPDAYTLQLFAVNQLDEIENLVAANPEVDLQVLVSARNEPRYRVIYGVFNSEDAARGAYSQLPENIRQAQPVPLVKSISGLREEVGNADRVASANASKYTLQVFATDNADSARRLQADYPALKLSLLETTNPYTRYRLLYGMFDSEEMAKQAAVGLPPELLQNVGDPLIKTVSELQAVKR